MPSSVTPSRHHGSAALVALWFGVILCSVTFDPVGAWIPFFGEETHKHLNLESHHREWDILDLLSINGSQTGVSAARGPIPDTPAWRLRAVYDNIQLDPSLVPKIASTLHDELTLYFVYKQHKKTLGSLISINMPGKIKPWFQVISNLKTQRLNVFYHIKEDSKTHQASFPMPDKVGWTWTRILVSVNQTQVRFWVNCADYDKQKLAGHIDLQIPEGSLIYFRQEPGLKNKLIGSIQMAKLMNYSVNDRVWKCSYDSQFGPGWRPPLLANDEDYCEPVYLELDEAYGVLDTLIIKHESDSLKMTQKLETCGCDVSCEWAGRPFASGAHWLTDPCTECTCQMGEVACDMRDTPTCLDPCRESPCLNGGVCNSHPGFRNFTCTCRPGWRGEKCQYLSHTCPVHLLTLRLTPPPSQQSCDEGGAAPLVVGSVTGHVFDPITGTCREITGCEAAPYAFQKAEDCEQSCVHGVCCFVQSPAFNETAAFSFLPECVETTINVCKGYENRGEFQVVSFAPNTTELSLPPLITVDEHCNCPGPQVLPGVDSSTSSPPAGETRGERPGESNIRQDITALPQGSLHEFIRAFRRLFTGGRMHEIARTYAHFMASAHRPRAWLGVNRALVKWAEGELQRVGGCRITLPIWDFTSHAKNLSGSEMWRNVPADFSGSSAERDLRLPVISDDLLNHSVVTTADILLALAHHDFEAMSSALWRQVSRVMVKVGAKLPSNDMLLEPVFYLMSSYVDKIWTFWQRDHPDIPEYAQFTFLAPFNLTLADVWPEGWSCGSYHYQTWEGECEDPPGEVRSEELSKVSDSLLQMLHGQPKELIMMLKTPVAGPLRHPSNTSEDEGSGNEMKELISLWKALTWQNETEFEESFEFPEEQRLISSHLPENIKGLEMLGLNTGLFAWWCSCGRRPTCSVEIIEGLINQSLVLLSNASITAKAMPLIKICEDCEVLWRTPVNEDPCWSSPCLNGGICIPIKTGRTRARTGSSGFSCLCQSSFQGRLCHHTAVPNCFLTTDPGECPAGVQPGTSQRWSYNPEEGNCAPFTYNGCGGNSNNHLSHKACIDACTRGTCCFRRTIHISFDQMNAVIINGVTNESTTQLSSAEAEGSVHSLKDLDCLRPVRADDEQQNTRNRLWKWECPQTLKDACVTAAEEDQAVTFTPGVSTKPTPAPPVCGCRFLDQHYKVGEVRKSSCHTCRCQQSGTFTCMRHGESSLPRKEFRDLTRSEMNQYVEAVARLAAEEGEVSWHSLTDLYASHLPHFAGTNFYLPWHRYFLWVVELILQDDGDCDLTIPYFDWTLDVGDLAGSKAWQANYFGGDGNDETRCVRFNPFHSPSYPKWSPCLMRQFDNYVWLPDAVSLAHLLANDNYTTFRIHLEAMSGLFQMFVGGHALTPQKFYDPIFLSHIAFLDKVWDDWMARNVERAESYLASASFLEVEPFGVTPKDVMKSSYLGVSYVLPSKGAPCLRDNDTEVSDRASGMSENMLMDSAATHIDNDGYDSYGFDSQGYDRSGYNKDSFNRDGYSIAGIDRMGYDRYGFDAQGCTALGVPYCRSSLNSTKLESPVFDSYGYTKSGFNILGLDRRGYDVFGFDLEGYDGEKCNYHHKGPFYKLLKAQIEQRLNGFTDEALLKNIERTCPPVTPVPEWWLEYNHFSKTDVEVLRQQEKAASILRPMVSPHRMDSRSPPLQSEPYLPQEYLQRLCLNLRPYSGCQPGDPVVDCNEEEVCRPYTSRGRDDAPSYFSYTLNDSPVTTKPSFSFYPFLTSLFVSPPFDLSYESPGPITFFPISPGGGGGGGGGGDFPQVASATSQSLLHCARRPNIVCRALGCDGVCRPTFIDAITGKESACDGCVDQSGQLREEGSTWTGDNCETCTCNHREMTCQPVTCPKVPCTHPAKRHGACCPDCQHGCIYDSYIVPEGETVEDVNDTCTECLCTRGSLVCGPVVCPELTCSDPVHKPGECCAFCNSCDGAEEGDSWQPDPCTHCQCKQGEQLCYSLGCSPPACHNPARPQGECCPVCHHCDYQGHHIMNGDSKIIAPCITCSCNLGTVTCQSEECGPPVCLHPESIPGECCPRCPGQCSYDDRVIATGSTFQPSFNPCLNCSCQDTRVACVAVECRPPPCPGAIVLPGRCCPDHCPNEVPCVDSRGKSRLNGETWMEDETECRKCSCDSGVITCTGETCQKCPYGVPVPGSCCPDCSRCFVGGQLVDNKVWFNRGGDPCEPCQCLDGSLKCRPRTTCPELSCLLKHRPDGECCPVCIGCIDDRGQTWDEGQHWTLESDPCQQCQCHKNLITCARAQCQVYCSHPVPPAPSTCCPTCEACLYRSKIYAQDERIPTTDPCSECYCKNGSLVCYTQSCKPVYCTNAQIRPGECCPTCSECNYLGQTYEDDSEWPSPSDPCVTCRCQGGHVECQDGRESCNPQCSHPAKPPGQCCPLCDNCLYLDQEYVNGMAFRSPSYDSDCYECHCKNGNVQCYKKHCPPLSCVVSVLVTSECCPKCLDHQVTYATALPAFRVTPSPFDSSYVHETNFFLSTTAFPGVSSSSSSSPSSLPSSSSASLCESCRHTSCSIEGITYKIDESFVHPNNPCQQCTCLESGITCSRVFCPRTPCTHPAMPTDACCPTCQDCLFTQVIYPNATTFTHEDDPCQKCTCKEGNVLCETIKCPTTECSNPKTMDDVCCPICLEPKRCRFHDRFFNYHEIFPHPKDHCQECSCTEGIVTCKERPCPPYACPSPRLKDCCYDCFGCSYAGKTVENYVSFFDPLDPCRTCSCVDGRVNCYRVSCPAVECLQPITPPDSCCPVCQECDYEDEIYYVGETFESFYDPCTECRCDYPDVTCYPRYCPAPTCMYPAPDADGCCQMCYNCLFEGILYHNGQHFPDPSDPCAQCSCRMGDIQCTAVPCDRPRCPYPVPGRCCPECGSGCQYGDVIIPDGGMFPSGMAECQECICHAGYVTCVPTRCPDVYCTHPATVGCCPHCEGCLFEGRDIENGMVFSHPGKPCEECRCTAGSVTCNPLKCPEAPCTHPRVVNCCPSCSVGCRYHETLLEEGETIFSPSDPCHTCLCKRGSVKCARRKCPDLSCPVESQIPGECCPRCPTSNCLYEDKVYPHDARFTDPYTCQDCICQEGRVECSVLLCPELSCPNQVRVNGSCCPICDQSCEYNQVRYTAGQKFTPEDRPCQICTCEEGEIVCDDVPCGLPDCTHPIPADLNECCPFSCSGCSFEGKTFADGQSFNHSCSSCQCQVGNITCSPIKCPELKCDVPIVPEGEGCCATCPSCHHMGITLPPEYRFIDPDQPCSLCVCHNGEVTCFHETCPAEDCRPGEVFQKLQPEDCCPVCMNSLDAINSNARGTYDEVGTEDIQYYAHEQKKEERIIFQLEKGLGSIQTFVYNKDVSKGGSLNETLGQEEPSAIDEGHVEGSLEDDFLRNVSLAAGEEPELVSVNLDQLEEQYRPEFHANEPDVLGLNITSSTSEFSTQNVSKEEGEDESAETPENSTEITTTLSPAAPDEHDFNETFSNFEDSNDTTAGNTTAVPSSNSSISQQELAQRINSKLKDLTFNVALPSDKEQLKFNVKIKVSKRMNDSDTEIPRGVTKRKCRGKNPFNIVQISESEPPTPSNISVFTSNSNENDTSLSLNEVSDDIEGTQRPPASLLLPNISTDDSDNITSTTPKHQETLIITSDHAPSVSNYAYLEREKEILEHIIAEGVKLSEFQNESGNINEENIDITTVTPLSSTSTTEAPDSSKDSQLDTVFSVLPSRSVELSTSKPDLTKEFESSEIPKEGSSTSLVEDFSESINEQHSIPSPPYSSIHHPEAVTYSTESPSDDFYSISTSPSATQSHSLSSAGIQSTEATPHLTSPFPLHVANSSIMEDLTTSIIASNDIPVTISPSPSSKEDSMDTSLEDYKNLGNSRADTEQTTSPANVLVVSTASSETLPSESSILLMMNGTRYPTTDSPDNSNSKSEPGYSELFGENGETNLVSFEENPVLITAASTDASSLDLDVATEAALSFLESSVTTEQGFANVSNVTDLRPTSLGEVTVTAMPTSNSTSTYLPLGGHCDFEEVGKSVSLPDDPCTNCTCNSSLHWECSQVWCPPLDCPLEELYLHEGECCPICKACEVSIGNQLLQYGEGESWSDPRKPCSVCVCHNGHSRCSASHCISPPQIYSPADCLGVTCPELKCTESQEERYNPGACCPVCAPASQRCVWWGRHIRTFDGLLLQHRSQCAYTFLQHCPETLFTIYTKFGDSSRGLAVVVVTVVVGEVEIELGQDGGVTVDGIKESLPHITSTTAIYSHGHNVVLITNNGLQVVWHVRGQVEVVVGGEHMGKTCGLCGNLNNHPQDDFSLPSGLQSTNIEEFLESWSIGEKCVAPEPQRFCSKSGAALDSHSYGYVNRSCSILKGPSFQKCHRVVPPDPYIEACITEVCGCQEETRSVCLCDSLHLYSTLCTRAGVILNWRTSYLCEPSCPLGMVWSECVPACGPALCGPPPASRTVKHNSFVSFLSAVSSHSVSSHENTPAQKCPGPCVPGCTCPRGYALQNATCIPLTECL